MNNLTLLSVFQHEWLQYPWHWPACWIERFHTAHTPWVFIDLVSRKYMYTFIDVCPNNHLHSTSFKIAITQTNIKCLSYPNKTPLQFIYFSFNCTHNYIKLIISLFYQSQSSSLTLFTQDTTFALLRYFNFVHTCFEIIEITIHAK